METITNPINTLAKIQGMNKVDVKRYEKMCQKALKTAKNDVCVVKTKNGEKNITTDALCQILDALDYRYNVLTQNWDKIHGLFENETKSIKNVNEKFTQKCEKSVAKQKKINYIKTTNKTKTTNSNGDKTMMNEVLTKNEIAKIAPNAVKNILAAQNKNKTDTKKTYWGGWGKVRAGMNAAYNDYEKYQNLETEWLELRQKLGGKNSPLYHFCWKLINNNRVGVKQEPNSTLRFIKNAKIRIAMANDVLANKKKYENEIAENWSKTFGTEI